MGAKALVPILLLAIIAITGPGCTDKAGQSPFADVGRKSGESKAPPHAETGKWQTLVDNAPPLPNTDAVDMEAKTERSSDKRRADFSEKGDAKERLTGPAPSSVSSSSLVGVNDGPAAIPPVALPKRETDMGKKISVEGAAKVEAGGSPAPPPAAVADPVVGRATSVAKPARNEPQSGILTAGSFDDNINPQVFSSYVKKMNQLRGLGDLPTLLQGQRLLVIVKDGAGKPVGNARVKLSGGASSPVEIITCSDGRAVFMLSLDQLPTDQGLLATVTGPNGGNPVTDTISAGSARWEITMPGVQAQLPKNLDLCIVLDTTGSMTDEIRHLKAEIRGISLAIKNKFPEVNQRLALVCYRDEGDEYVTRPFDFTTSLDLFHKNLAAQSAAGGGDYPEAMHKGLEESLQLRWQEKDTVRVMFLIADAPPHAQHMNRTLAAVNTLRKKGVAVYPIACSGYDDACEFVMRSSALLTGSQFLFLTDDSGVGNSHAEPRIPYYRVERLEKLMVRMIASELSGQHIQPSAGDIIRTVGKKVN